MTRQIYQTFENRVYLIKIEDVSHRERLKRYWLLAVIFVIPFASCNRVLNQPNEVGVASALQESVGAVYPHSIEFRTTRAHGGIYKTSPETCKTCHGNDLKGGSSQVSCQQCHSAYPHDSEIRKTALHGMTGLNEISSCLRCHGKQKDSVVSASIVPQCSECHAYPHDPQWILPKNHGEKYVESKNSAKPGQVDCMTCHDESKKSKKKDYFISCGTCHLAMPHPEDITDSEVHGKMLKDDPASCVACHTDYTKHLDNYGGCIGCHGMNLKINVTTEFVDELAKKKVNPHSKKERDVASKKKKN